MAASETSDKAPFAKALGKGIGQSLEPNPHELA
jgi:hypothetical protein